VPSQISAVMVISERGTMGEFNIGQTLVARTMRPVLDSLAISHHTLTDEATMPYIVDKSIKQAFMTQAPVAFILSPLLTGGNPVAAEKLKV
jgi:sulfopyruvate decarboxylase TPP-binding subunit